MKAEEVVADRVSNLEALAGKYLSFKLGGEEYGLAILKVQEIIGMMTITRIPRTPECFRGVINLRGKVIPVLDLRRKFQLPGTPDTDRTCIIVVRMERQGERITMGVLVDDVSEVKNVTSEQLEAPPEFGSTLNSDFIQAMAKIGTRVVILLDIDKVMCAQEILEASRTAASARL